MKKVLSLVAIALMATLAFATPIVDGTKDAEYGPAVAVQMVQTSFDDNDSEWNAGYGRIDAGKLYLMLTGNLQNNFNKLEIFIDSKAGGQSIVTVHEHSDFVRERLPIRNVPSPWRMSKRLSPAISR